MKGESEVLSLYLTGRYDAIASDDMRFLKKLVAARIPYVTPVACVIFLHKSGALEKSRVLELLEVVKPWISNEEYEIARYSLEVES